MLTKRKKRNGRQMLIGPHMIYWGILELATPVSLKKMVTVSLMTVETEGETPSGNRHVRPHAILSVYS